MAISLIIFSSTSLLMSGGFVNFSFSSLATGMVNSGIGHVSIAHESYFNAQGSLRDNIISPEQRLLIEQKISTLSDLDYYIKSTKLDGLVAFGDNTKSIIIEITEIDKRIKLANFQFPIVAGSAPKNTEENPYQAILGINLAHSLGVNIGDTVVLLASTPDGGINAVDTQVSAILSTGIADIDVRTVMIPRALMEPLLYENITTNYSLVAKGEDNTNASSLFKQALPLFEGPSLQVKYWQDIAVYYKQVHSIYMIMFSFFFLMLGVVLFISIMNIMATVVLERMKEAGTMLSFGFTVSRVRFNFFLEGMMLCIIGLLGSAGMTLILTLIVNHSGLMMPPPPGMSNSYPFLIQLDMTVVLIDMLIVGVACMFASYIPSRRVKNSSIVNLINHI